MMLNRLFKAILTLSLVYLLPAQLWGQCNANFSFEVDPTNSLIIGFKNLSTGSIDSLRWDFDIYGFEQDTLAVVDSVSFNFPVEDEMNVTLTTIGACVDDTTITIAACDTCVYPGDINWDGVANNLDLLYIGLVYGDIGDDRVDTTTIYTPHTSANWPTSIGGLGLLNAKHADTDGSGEVIEFDTSAIHRNYGLIHSKTGATSPCTDPLAPPLFLVLPDSARVGDMVEAEIHLGDLTTTAIDAYGIAFSINYDRLLVDSGSVRIDMEGGVLGYEFGGDTVVMDIYKDFHDEGKAEIGATRINRSGRNVSGQIGVMYFVMEDDIAQKDSLYSEYLNFTFADVTLLDEDGQPLDFCAKDDSIVVSQLISGIADVQGNTAVKLYPNPATQQVQLLVNADIMQYTVFNSVGQVVEAGKGPKLPGMRLNVANYPAGPYFIQLKLRNGQARATLLVE